MYRWRIQRFIQLPFWFVGSVFQHDRQRPSPTRIHQLTVLQHVAPHHGDKCQEAGQAHHPVSVIVPLDMVSSSNCDEYFHISPKGKLFLWIHRNQLWFSITDASYQARKTQQSQPHLLCNNHCQWAALVSTYYSVYFHQVHFSIVITIMRRSMSCFITGRVFCGLLGKVAAT